MNQDTQMLQQICKSTQMGQSGIRAVFTGAREPAMKQALASQLREYDAIHHQADRLLRDRGESAQRIPGLVLAASRMGAQMRLARDGSSSKIAEMMIEGNTKGMVKSMRQNRALHALDPKVSNLSNRLLQTELTNIEQMKPFL
ncbi:MAG: hypothetical protein E7424_09675 [Ruminococcaceae bacterium]|nr:hypothetical protein [Oscillospiraceae bacterium]